MQRYIALSLIHIYARHEIFAAALEGKEITFDEVEDESPDLQM